MITEKLYETDSYIRCFEAAVTECIPCDDKYKIVLDRTAFFPEGGGQASDTGFIDGVKVLDVQEKDGTVYHYAESPVDTGKTVTGEIDWNMRFSNMQNHTGEHIVSGIIHSKFGYNNVGFHLGAQSVTLDVDGPLTEENIAEVEREANIAVFSNLTVTVSYPSKEELETLEYRSKLDFTENVRIVTIGGVDRCACCAPHVSRTGEIGVIKIINHFPHRKGTRMEMLCGFRAYEDYCLKDSLNAQIMKLLASPSDQTAEAVQRSLEKTARQTAEIKALKDELALAKLSVENINGISFAILPDASFDELISCVNHINEDNSGVSLVVSEDNGGCIFVLASKECDIQPILAGLRAELGAKGGGRNNSAQGKIPHSAEEIKKFIINN